MVAAEGSTKEEGEEEEEEEAEGEEEAEDKGSEEETAAAIVATGHCTSLVDGGCWLVVFAISLPILCAICDGIWFQAKKRAKRTVQSWSTTQQIVFQQENPKRRQSKSAARYERYKSACTVAEFLGLGGSGGDLLHDCEKGYVREVDSDFLTDSD